LAARELFLMQGTVEAAVKAAIVGTVGQSLGGIAEVLAAHGKADEAVELLLLAGEVVPAIEILRENGKMGDAAVLARGQGCGDAARAVARVIAEDAELRGVAAVMLAAVGAVQDAARLFVDADEREQAEFIAPGAVA
jgi:hypothetical protein